MNQGSGSSTPRGLAPLQWLPGRWRGQLLRALLRTPNKTACSMRSWWVVQMRASKVRCALQVGIETHCPITKWESLGKTSKSMRWSRIRTHSQEIAVIYRLCPLEPKMWANSFMYLDSSRRGQRRHWSWQRSWLASVSRIQACVAPIPTWISSGRDATRSTTVTTIPSHDSIIVRRQKQTREIYAKSSPGVNW